ncbi:MAG: Uma2 family endonuclease [Polyangiaceae bacterium]
MPSRPRCSTPTSSPRSGRCGSRAPSTTPSSRPVSSKTSASSCSRGSSSRWPPTIRREHPSSAHLLIEVACSSLRKDRLVKAPLYARSGFREYWIVNVRAKVVEVHRGPSPDGWASITRHSAPETLHPEAFPDVAVPIAAILR